MQMFKNVSILLRHHLVASYFCLLHWSLHCLRSPTTVTSKPNAHSKFKSLTTNSKHSQQIQITHSKLQIVHSRLKTVIANYKSFTANSNHSQQITNCSQQIQITHSKLQIVDPARRLQSPTASGARRLKIFVVHEATTLESSRHLVDFPSSSTNENHVLFSLWAAFANIFMAEIETNLLNQSRIKPIAWKRYIDDVFSLWEKERTSMYS